MTRPPLSGSDAPTAIYNEIEPAALACLELLQSENIIAPGRVEGRSIKELTAHDLAGFPQCHFFAGAGSWSHAARLAGWPDHWPLWTASCPCQPFSQAGKRAGFDDERHLWPDLLRLIDECIAAGNAPPVIVGEQVAGQAGYTWFDRVRADLGARGYETWVVNIPAAAVDAPHIRQRLYWAAIRGDLAQPTGAAEGRRELCGPGEGGSADRERASGELGGSHGSGVTLGNSFQPRLEGQPRHGDGEAGWPVAAGSVAEADGGDVGNATSDGREQGQYAASIARHRDQLAPTHGRERLAHSEHAKRRSDDDIRGGSDATETEGWQQSPAELGERHSAFGRNGSFWSDSEWLICHDQKARRTKPGLCLLVDGRVGRISQWRIAGNGIVVPLAAEVIATIKDVIAPYFTRPFPATHQP